MKVAQPHPQEAERLQALRDLHILDSALEDGFQEIVSLAADLTSVPISLVSLVDEHRQWFKARVGVDATETPRDWAFCAHAILNADEVFVVEDASQDDRFHDNPLVTDAPAIRFYAGVPLRAPESELPIGTLCVIGPEVKHISDRELERLRILARQVERLFLLRDSARKLAASNEELHLANQARENFLARVSHELRTPLNSILGFCKILERNKAGHFDEGELEKLARVHQNGDLLLSLVNQLLDLAKIDAGKVEVREREVDLNAQIRNVIENLRGHLVDKSVTLQAEMPAELRQLVTDPEKLTQILINLVGNAIKFTDEGSIVVSIEDDESGVPQRIVVTDSGPGISADGLGKIFTAFQQELVGRQRGGTGLGLTISQALCELLGFQLRVESELGHGASFIIDLHPERAAA